MCTHGMVEWTTWKSHESYNSGGHCGSNGHHYYVLTAHGILHKNGVCIVINSLPRNSNKTISSEMPGKWGIIRLLDCGIVTSHPRSVTKRPQKNDKTCDSTGFNYPSSLYVSWWYCSNPYGTNQWYPITYGRRGNTRRGRSMEGGIGIHWGVRQKHKSAYYNCYHISGSMGGQPCNYLRIK